MKWLLFVPMLFICSVTYAAPTVSSLSGNTLTGASFGNAPDIVFFDDFENGTLNDDISLSGAVYGEYNGLSSTYQPYYTNSIAVSGNLAMQSDLSLATGVAAYVTLNATEIFIDWHLQLPADTNPPYGSELSINWKQMWLLGESTVDDDLVIPTVLGSTPPYIVLDDVDYYVNGNESDPGYTKSLDLDAPLTYGDWAHWSCHIKGGYNNDGVFKFWEVYSGGVHVSANDTGVNTLKSGGLWKEVGINAYGRQTDDCNPSFDDVYIAVGANCQARLVVGDNATYLSSTKTAIQVADEDNWSATEIDVYAWNQGAFTDNETAYLFVIDTDGSVSNGLQGHFLNGTFYTGSTYTKLSNITASNITFS